MDCDTYVILSIIQRDWYIGREALKKELYDLRNELATNDIHISNYDSESLNHTLSNKFIKQHHIKDMLVYKITFYGKEALKDCEVEGLKPESLEIIKKRIGPPRTRKTIHTTKVESELLSKIGDEFFKLGVRAKASCKKYILRGRTFHIKKLVINLNDLDECGAQRFFSIYWGYASNDDEQTKVLINGESAWIDNDIVDLIKLLNEGGFTTRFSCSGHKSTKRKAMISFDIAPKRLIGNDLLETNFITCRNEKEAVSNE